MFVGNSQSQPQPKGNGIHEETIVSDHVRLELRGPDGKIKEVKEIHSND